MKAIKLIRLIVYHTLLIGILSCNTDEDYNSEVPATKLSFSQDHYFLNPDADSVTIPIELSTKPARNGFVEIALTGDMAYDQDYSTNPQADDDKVQLELVAGVRSTSFTVNRKNFNLEEEKSLHISLARPSLGFALGPQVTASIKFEMNEVSLSEVNFSAEEEKISEDTSEGTTVKIILSTLTRKSENLKISVSKPSHIDYDTHFTILPMAILDEISLDIPPLSDSISFKVFPIDDQVLIGDYELLFELEGMTDGLKMGAMKKFIVIIEENDDYTGATHTISSLKEGFVNYPNEWFIPSDYFIEGIITSDVNVMDNKAAYIQDETGGILIRFNTPNTLKLGDKIRMNLINGTGKILNDQKSIDGISLGNTVLHDENLVVEAENITIEQLHSGNYEGKRIRLENVEFQNANGVLSFVGSHNIIQGSAVASVLTYPSAPFSDFIIPTGKVTVSGIVGDWGRLMPQKIHMILLNDLNLLAKD